MVDSVLVCLNARLTVLSKRIIAFIPNSQPD